MTYMPCPNFTGRNVPIEEIAEATGLSPNEVVTAILDGEFEFAIILGNRNECKFYCSDKKVWEEIGYFKFKVTEELFPEKAKERVFATGEFKKR